MPQKTIAPCDCKPIHEATLQTVREKMPPAEDLSALADFYKLFADKTRIQILCALCHSEMCVCDLAVLLNTSKSAVSHQLRQLRLAKLLRRRKEGKEAFYSLADSHIRAIFEQGFEHIQE